MNIRVKTFIVLMLFGSVLIMIAYSNSLDVPFQYDGHRFIKENANIRTTSGVSKLIKLKNRSVFYLSLAFNYAVNRYNVAGYHILNILIHFFNTIILFLLFSKTLSLSKVKERYRKHRNSLSLSAALLFAVHPVHTESVTYIYQRSTSIVALFFILSIYLYACARTSNKLEGKVILFSLTIITAVLCFLSKPNAAMLPLFIFLYELFFFQELNFKKNIKLNLVALLLSLVFIAAYPKLFTPESENKSVAPVGKVVNKSSELTNSLHKGLSVIFPKSWEKTYKERGFNSIERFMTQWRVLVYYPALMVYPHPSLLRIDYDFPVSRSLISPWTTLPAGLLLTGIFAFALWLSRRDVLISFAIFWYFGTLAIESTFPPLMIAFEHRTYLPTMFLFLLFTIGLKYVFDFTRTSCNDLSLKGLIFRKENIVIVLILCIFTYWTYERNIVWKSEESLWKDTVKKSPDRPKPHVYMGKVFYSKSAKAKGEERRRLLEISMKESKKAVEIHRKNGTPVPFAPYVNLGLAYGRLEMNKEAEEALTKALKRNPSDSKTLESLGIIYGKTGRLDEAEKLVLQAMKYQKGIPNHHNSLGIIYGYTNRTDMAIEQFKKAIELYPEYGKAYGNLAMAYRQKGDMVKAKECLEMAKKYSDSNN